MHDSCFRPIRRWVFPIATKFPFVGSMRALLSAVFLTTQSFTVYANSLPTDGTVVAGQVSIGTPSGGTLHIQQSGGHAIINWNGFSVGNGNAVSFDNGSGATLNRVTGTNLSAIDGLLTATGSLFLINPNGVIIGESGVVTTGGSFVASTLDVADDDFLDGGDITFFGGSDASVINLGQVSGLGGDVALIGRQVANHGFMTAAHGGVGLIAGHEILMRDGAQNDGLFAVKIGSVGTSVTNTGRINAATAELRANLGNVYALAGNNGGAIHASGSASSEGRIFLTAEGGTVHAAGEIQASRSAAGGGDVFISADEVLVSGEIDVSGLTGGSIDVTGASVAVTDALLDASGTTAGGTVRIGGALQGGDEVSLANADTVSINEGSVISADGLASGADGGTVIIWSDEETQAGATITARGGDGGSGGFVEVSSRGRLVFEAHVDTGGGTLLLDPTDLEIGAVDTGIATSFINVSTVGTLLANNNVVITTHDASGTLPDEGHIYWTSELSYDASNDLSLLAHGNIVFSASLQNSNDTGGAINLVAGWDGVSGLTGGLTGGPQTGVTFDNSVFAGADLSSQTIFGRSYDGGTGFGSVLIGDGVQGAGIAVGSRSGATRIYAHDLVLTGSDSTDNAYAQLGYRVSNEPISYAVTGDLFVRATGDITAQAGEALSAYAQIGHVARDPIFDPNPTPVLAVNADIRVEALGDLIFTGGGIGAGSYVQLGHGGRETEGNHSGSITIAAASDLIFTSGGGTNSYAQLGHGGAYAEGNYSGSITITGVNDLTFTGDRIEAYAQLGHGGFGAFGNHSGSITITDVRDLTFTGGGGQYAYTQLGHGGAFAEGNHSGSITITEVNDLTFSGGTASRTYAQLGHGAADFGSGLQVGGTRTGAIFIEAAGELSVQDGATPSSRHTYGWIGHGSADADAISDADVFIQAASFDRDSATSVAAGGTSVVSSDMLENALEGGSVTLIADGTSLSLAAATGVLNRGTTYTGYDDQSYASAHELTLISTHDLDFSHVGLQNAYDPDPLGDGTNTDAGLGAINLVAGYNRDQSIWTVDSGDTDTWVLDTAAFDGELLVGGGTSFGLSGGDVLIGDGAQVSGVAVGSRSGATRVYADNLVLTGSDSTGSAYAQLGYRVSNQTASHRVTGDLSVRTTGGITAEAGEAQSAHAQVGHVGADLANDAIIEADVDADIWVEALGDLTFTGDGGFAYAQLGHGGIYVDGNHSGSVTITGANDLTFTGGGLGGSYAQLGHGGFSAGVFSNGNYSGAITITEVNDLVFSGGSDVGSYAQLGNGGSFAFGNHSGSITITGAGDLTFTGGGDIEVYAQLGHGGNAAFGNHSGSITITDVNDLTFSSGTASRTYAQLGHGGTFVQGNHSGSITITEVNDLTFSGGTASGTYAQLGHGSADFGSGFQAVGTRTGAIFIEAAGELSVQDGATPSSRHTYGWIGHGSADADAISDADVFIQAASFDRDSTTSVAAGGTSVVSSDMLENALEGGSVTLIADGTSLSLADATGVLNRGATYTGYDDQSYASAHELTLISTHDLDFSHVGLQNAYDPDPLGDGSNTDAGLGAINLVAGYNSTQSIWTVDSGDTDTWVLDTAAFDGEVLVGGGTSFGLSGGDVLIGDGAQVSGVAVGSRSGATRVYADNLVLTGSDTTADAYAQLGYRVSNQTASHRVTGDLSVRTTGAITAEAGEALSAYAQIGHVGADLAKDATIEADVDADIWVEALGDLTFSGGSGMQSYAQLGHGGIEAEGDHSGAISITEVNDLTFSGGSGMQSYAQLGHGGFFAEGNHSGSITITGVNDFTFTGDGVEAYAQLGHGGFGADGNHSGAITITDAQDLTFRGGPDAYVQLGHGGIVADGNHSGSIIITGANDLSFTGGSIENAYTQLGHGGLGANGNHSGSITITDVQDLTFTGGTEAYVQLGHGGIAANGDHSGAIMIAGANDLNFSGGSGSDASAQLGHGGFVARGNHSGSITITDVQDLTFTGGGGDSYAQLGHGGIVADGNHSGSITITEANDLIFTSGSDESSHTQLGHGGPGAYGNHSGSITITEIRDLSFAGGSGEQAYAQLGHGGFLAEGNHSGSITITEVNDLTFSGGNGEQTYAQLGHGSADFGSGSQAGGTRAGAIFIEASGELSVQDGTTPSTSFNYGWIGHGSASVDAISNADVFIQAASFDRDSATSIASGDMGVFSSDMLENALEGGTVTIKATDSGLSLDSEVVVDGAGTNNQLQLIAANDIELDYTITNNGAGNIILVAGDNFHNNTGGVTPITTAGQWLVYSTRPDLNDNDVDIANYDGVAFGVSFDASSPLSSYENNGNWLLYSGSPTVSVTANDQAIPHGATYDSTDWTLTVTDGVTAITDISDYLTLIGGVGGLSVTDRLAATDYDADGAINSGTYVDGLTVAGLIAYDGLTTLVVDGTLSVGEAPPVDPEPPVDQAPPVKDRSQFLLPCEPSSGAMGVCPAGNSRWISEDRAGLLQ